MNPKMKKILFMSLAIFILILIPVLIALPFQIVYGNVEIMEVSLVVSGLFYLLAMNVRYSLKSRRNHKKHTTDKEFKETDEGKRYVTIQNTMIIAGIVNILLSLLYFAISSAFI